MDIKTQFKNISPEAKRGILTAIATGNLKLTDFTDGGLNVQLFSLQDIPLFADYNPNTETYTFCNQELSVDAFNRLLSHYEMRDGQKPLIFNSEGLK